jgi:hypothetical protein
VPHIFDAAAIFGPDNIAGGARASYKSYNAPVVPLMMAYFTSFVRTLDPNTLRMPGSMEWQGWGSDMRRMLVETEGASMENTPGEERERCAFWLGLGERLQQKRGVGI